jgi:hypothetical protein
MRQHKEVLQLGGTLLIHPGESGHHCVAGLQHLIKSAVQLRLFRSAAQLPDPVEEIGCVLARVSEILPVCLEICEGAQVPYFGQALLPLAGGDLFPKASGFDALRHKSNQKSDEQQRCPQNQPVSHVISL